MKKHFFLFLFTLLSFSCLAQISFEKSYFINNQDMRTECLIKNIDWKNNPTEFEFKLSETDEPQTESIDSIIEFGIYDYSKYIRRTVKIDRSSSKLNELSIDINPVFNEEELFLEVLVEGKSNLYKYEDASLIRFFYNVEGLDDIEQLVFKKYLVSGEFISENNGFRHQLLNDLKCQSIDFAYINSIRYEQKELLDLFIKYNECSNARVENYVEKQKKDLFHLNLRVGLNSSSLKIDNIINDARSIDFGRELSFRLGIETEFIMPFNKNKWAVIVEPTYQYFKSEGETRVYETEVDYKSIEIPIGIRHYFFLNDNSKIFVNGSWILDFVIDSKVSYDTGANTTVEIENSSNLAFGAGYKVKDKYSFELRYHTPRELFTSQIYYSDYNTVSVIFGYTVF